MFYACVMQKKSKDIYIYIIDIYGHSIYHGPPKPTFLEVFMVNNLVFRWPKPLFFMVWGAHGTQMNNEFEGLQTCTDLSSRNIPTS